MNGNAIDWKTLYALSRLFDEIGYPAEKILIAMKDASEYNGGKQQNGELRGTKTQLARAVGCKPETVVNIWERLLRLENGGHELLRAERNEENPKELCFQSEQARNALAAMFEKRQGRIQRRDARKSAREHRGRDENAVPAPAVARDEHNPARTAPAAENCDSRAAQLDRLKRQRNYFRSLGDSLSRERAAEIEKQIQNLESAPAADFENMLASLGICGNDSETETAVPAT